MNGVVLPWLAEIGIISWRTVKQDGRPPLPSEIVATFIVFGSISLLANSQPQLASALGWGFVIATAVNVWDTTSGKPKAGTDNKTQPPRTVTRPGIN